jgi:hypothetical protein
VILTGRNSDRPQNAATELGALSAATFDADDSAALEAFFADLEACQPTSAGLTASWIRQRHGLRSSRVRRTLPVPPLEAPIDHVMATKGESDGHL